MNFASLSYFEVLAQELSFTKAAQRLHITQQSLSSNVAKMEQELGCQLVVRHVPLELTYAGQVLARYAASFREEYTTMQQEFCDISQNQKGVLRVGVTYTRGRTIMPAIVQEFHKLFPAIRIDLVEDTNDVLRRKLVEGEMDLAITNFIDSIPGVAVREFYREEVIMVVLRSLFESLHGDKAEERARRLEEGDFSAIEGCPLVLNSIDDISGHIERSILKQAKITNPNVIATSSNTETLLAFCTQGTGACFCPERLAYSVLTEEQLDSLLVLHLGESAQYRISFGYREQTYQWSAIEAFIDVAEKTMRG